MRRVTGLHRQRESGLTSPGCLALLIILTLVGIAIGLSVHHLMGNARGASMETDISTVQKSVDGYFLRSLGDWPTADGRAPAAGEYKPIDFDASFTTGGETYSLKAVLKRLPKHYSEGVWRIDSRGTVSVNMDPKDY